MAHQKQRQRLTSSWKEEILDYWGIQYVESAETQGSDYLWVTRCSKTKRIDGGIPSKLYLSSSNRYFYEYVKKRRLRYGILSDKYGLHLDREWLSYYDIHPSTLTDQDKEGLGELIKDKAQSIGFSKITFYNNSPLMSIPYFQMLYYSGLSIFYITSLNTSACVKSQSKRKVVITAYGKQ